MTKNQRRALRKLMFAAEFHQTVWTPQLRAYLRKTHKRRRIVQIASLIYRELSRRGLVVEYYYRAWRGGLVRWSRPILRDYAWEADVPFVIHPKRRVNPTAKQRRRRERRRLKAGAKREFLDELYIRLADQLDKSTSDVVG